MKYIVFGAGNTAKFVISNIIKTWNLESDDQSDSSIYLVDNKRYGFEYEAYGKKYPVYYPARLLREKDSLVIVISAVRWHEQIAAQLRQMGFVEGKDFFGWPGFVQMCFQETGIYRPDWELRCSFMSQMISEESESVLDLGCGNMYLKKLLKPEVQYIPCDCVKRDDETIVCDLNQNQYPDVHADTIFMSGILEHIKNYEDLIRKVCGHADKEVILSYCTLDYRPDYGMRCSYGAVNHLSVYGLVKLFEENGMRLENSSLMETPKEMVFKFIKG